MLGPHAIVACDGFVRVGDIESDYGAFQTAISLNRWMEASALIRGGFLEGLDCHEFDFAHWADGVRAGLSRQFARLVDELEISQAWKELSRLGSVLPPSDSPPLLKEHVDRIARAPGSALGSQHDPQKALEAGDPQADLRGLPRFVGRREEMKDLLKHWKLGRLDAHARAVLIEGPQGIGKSSLCLRFLKLAAMRGATSLSARGFEAESNLPYGIVEQLLTDSSTDKALEALDPPERQVLLEAFPMLQPRNACSFAKQPYHNGWQLRLYAAVDHLLSRIRAEAGLVLFVDDAHWMDAASLGLLHYLQRTSTIAGLLILLAAPESDALDLIRALPSADRIRVPPLKTEEVTELLQGRLETSRAPAPKQWQALDLVEQTGGNPLLITALLRTPLASPGRVQSIEPIRSFFRPRLLELSEPSQLVLAAVTVLGGRGAWEAVASVADVGSVEMTQAVKELTSEDLLCQDTTELTATHGLAGEVLLSDMPPLIKRLMHGRSARIRAGAPSAVLAVQHDIAGECYEAFSHAKSAASASLRLFAHGEAEFFLKLALAHAPDVQEETTVLLDLCNLYAALNRWADIAKILSGFRLKEATASQQAWHKVYLLSARLSEAGDVQTTLKEAWEAVAWARQHQCIDAAAEMLVRISTESIDAGLFESASRAAVDTLDIARSIEDPVERSRLSIIGSAVLGQSRSAVDALRLIESMDSPSVPDSKLQWLLAKAALSVGCGNLRSAEDDFLTSLALCERYGLVSSKFQILNNLGVTYVEMGRYHEAEQAFQRAKQVDSAAPIAQSEVLLLHDNLAVLYLERGDLSHAVSIADRSMLLNRDINSRRSWFGTLGVKGLACLGLGHLSAAAKCEREILLTEDQTGGCRISDMSYLDVFLARMSTHRGQEEWALQRLQDGIESYRHRYIFCSFRLRLEVLSIRAASDPEDVEKQLVPLIAQIRQTGARPLYDRACAQLARIRHRTSAF